MVPTRLGGRCERWEWNSAVPPQCGQLTLAPWQPFFLRQVLFEGLGGDLVGQVAEFELIGAEEVLVVGGDEGACHLVEFGVGSLAESLGQSLNGGEFLGRQRGRRHDGLQDKGCIFLGASG